jgi:uncharacterized protein involved in outer membrane biogenesis
MEMSPGKKRALLVIGGIVAALALAIAAVVLFVDFNRYKPRFETEASRALGLEVRIRGDMDVALSPPLGLTLAGIEVARNGEDVLRVERMRAGLKILPLFLGRIRFRELGFVRPELFIRRTTSGPFDFERYLYRPLQKAREILPGSFDRIDGISVTGGKISYSGTDPASRARLENVDLAIRDVAFPKTSGDELFRNVSFAGTVTAARAAIGNAEFSGISCGVTTKNGNYEIDPVSMQAFGGTGEGSVWVNLSVATPLVQVRYSITGFDIGSLFAASGRKRGILEGKVDHSANLFMKGGTPDALARTMTGDISWKGSDLTVPDFDPDVLLSASGKKKYFSLAQMRTFLLPGPPFPAAARGLSVPDNATGTDGGEGPVRTLVSTWTAKNGVFRGRIDLPGGRFDDITVALVDDRGCPLAGQTIRGPFRLPRIALATAAKPKKPDGEKPVAKSKEPAPEEGCEVFYAGSVPPPE